MLCDAATIREGLLHVLGGGATRIVKPHFPATLGANVALQFILEPPDFGAHEIAVAVRTTASDGEIARLTLNFEAPTVEVITTPVTLPIVVPLSGAIIPEPGTFMVEVILDGVALIEIPFIAEPA